MGARDRSHGGGGPPLRPTRELLAAHTPATAAASAQEWRRRDDPRWRGALDLGRPTHKAASLRRGAGGDATPSRLVARVACSRDHDRALREVSLPARRRAPIGL